MAIKQAGRITRGIEILSTVHPNQAEELKAPSCQGDLRCSRLLEDYFQAVTPNLAPTRQNVVGLAKPACGFNLDRDEGAASVAPYKRRKPENHRADTLSHCLYSVLHAYQNTQLDQRNVLSTSSQLSAP
jgi:hypothetical protein